MSQDDHIPESCMTITFAALIVFVPRHSPVTNLSLFPAMHNCTASPQFTPHWCLLPSSRNFNVYVWSCSWLRSLNFFAGAGKSISTPQDLFRTSGKEEPFVEKYISSFLHLNPTIVEKICIISIWLGLFSVTIWPVYADSVPGSNNIKILEHLLFTCYKSCLISFTHRLSWWTQEIGCQHPVSGQWQPAATNSRWSPAP